MDNKISKMNVFIAPSKQEKLKNKLDYIIKKEMLVLRPDGLYDYKDTLNISNLDIKSLLELPYRFHTINGNFDCSFNKLTSFEGCPVKIKWHFDCSNNKLTTLEGCPVKIKGMFLCSWNQLTSLEGCPKVIYENFSCSNNQLTTLEGGPEQVRGSYYCDKLSFDNTVNLKCNVTDSINVVTFLHHGTNECIYSSFKRREN